MIDKEDILPIISRIAIFGGMPEESLATMIGLLDRISIQDGDILFKEGDPPDHIYIVMAGRVSIVCSRESSPYELASFGIGDCLGEMSVIGIQPHSGSAVGQGATDFIVLSRRALMRLCEIDPRGFNILILNIAREACRRLLATDQKLLHYARV